ncbi:ABC transporter permease [Rhodococcus sp. PAM 2766]|uniref:ABC transporter permease n=1 Tax=Rhodococcus parequi TaxID=3137122 RepID=A0ABW9FEH9_9NOCA
MIWVTWRQFRTTILAAAGGILALAVVVLICGLGIRGSDRAVPFGTAFGCPKTGDGSAACWSESLITLTTLTTAVLPVVLGALVGVTVFSRDIERGTHVLGLSQSVSRLRWYWSRVLVVFTPITLAAVALGFTLEWARSAAAGPDYAYISTRWYGYSKLTFPQFQASGLAVGAYTLLALILGSLVGLLLRNLLGAMAVTLIAMTALMVGFQLGARPHYASPVVEARSLDSQYRVAYTTDDETIWQLSEGYVDAQGRRAEFDYRKCNQIGENYEWSQRPDETLAAYEAREATMIGMQDREFAACQRAQGLDRYEVRYHPDSLFRRFQVIEASLALMLSALLIIPSLWAVRRLRP